MQIICINHIFLNNFINYTFCWVVLGAGSFLEAFSTWKHKKIDQVCIYSDVFYCFVNSLCIFFSFFMYFIVLWFLLFEIFMHVDQYQAKLMIYKAKRGQNYWFTGQNLKFTLPFVLYTKWKKSHFLGWPLVAKRSRDSVTGGPIFANLVSKYPQDFKEKSHEAAWLKAREFCVRGKVCLGGGASEAPPPPSAVRVNIIYIETL